MLKKVICSILVVLVLGAVSLVYGQEKDAQAPVILTQSASTVSIAEADNDTFSLTFSQSFISGIDLTGELHGGRFTIDGWLNIWKSNNTLTISDAILVVDDYAVKVTLTAPEYDEVEDALTYTATIGDIMYQGKMITLADVDNDTFDAPILYFVADDDFMTAIRHASVGTRGGAVWWCAWLPC